MLDLSNAELFQAKFLIISALIPRESDENPPRYKPLYTYLSPLPSYKLEITRAHATVSLFLPCRHVYIIPAHRIRANNPVKEIARSDVRGRVGSGERASCTRRQIVWAESVSRAAQ